MLYISDLSRCLPATALSREPRPDAWHCLHYETCDADVPSGTMICAGSSVRAPDVSLPLDVSGWHGVYVGYWNPHHDYDSGTCIRVRLDNDPVWWSMARRAGHREDVEAFTVRKPCLPTRQLRSVRGYDVLHGLSQAVYSGG